MRIFKHVNVLDSPSLARELNKEKDFKPEFEEDILDTVEFLRSQLDIPFDELYHKETMLVKEVILAEKALREKEKILPNPLGDRLVKIKDLKNDLEVSDSEFETEH